MSDQPTIESNCGIAYYLVDGDKLVGRFVLELYQGEVPMEIGERIEGVTGEIAGIYAIDTHMPGGETFANGTVQFMPMGDQGAYKVEWIMNLTEFGQTTFTMYPSIMIYKAVGLATDDTHIAVACDNEVYSVG